MNAFATASALIACCLVVCEDAGVGRGTGRRTGGGEGRGAAVVAAGVYVCGMVWWLWTRGDGGGKVAGLEWRRVKHEYKKGGQALLF